jgi:cyclopropane fatty-acyl-phospholipid synthase-like methyltransferase
MNRFMDLNLYKDTFSHLIDELPPSGAILELGCGPGNVVKYIKANRPDVHILGIDLAPEMVKAAKAANPDSEFKLMDIRQADKIEGHFDAVIAAFCIPYLSSEDLTGVFAQMKRLTTARKGMIYISCMEGSREKSGLEKTSFTGASELYINYYPRKQIEWLITEHGFTIKSLYLKDYSETDGSTTTDLIFIAESCNVA